MSAGSISAAASTGKERHIALAGRLGSVLELRAPSAGEVALEVTGGFHAGATLDLDGFSYSVGSSIESDVVLKDPGIAPIHVHLRRKGLQMDVEAVGGDIVLNGCDVIPEGHGRRCRLPVHVTFGNASIRLTRVEQPRSGIGFIDHPMHAAAAVVSVLVMSVAAIGLSLAQTGEPAAGATFVDDASGLGPGSEQSPSGVLQEQNSPQTAGEQLKLRLAQARIGSLIVQENHGRLIVSGTLSHQQNDAWTEIQAWFDQTYGDHVILASDVQAGEIGGAPRLVLQAIWFGERPYVIAADGARYYEGAFTNDGWTVKKIGESELVLAKGDGSVALKYP